MQHDPQDNNGNTGAEAFRPDVVITEDHVVLSALHLRSYKLESGDLVDVSDLAREAGFLYPVAVTRALWEDINAIPEAYNYEDVKGRLWDVLYMATMAVRQSAGTETQLRYNLVLHVGYTNAYTVKLVCEPGDDFAPVITLSNPERDIDLPLGRIVITEGALDAFVTAQISPGPYLARHQHGDWGELGEEDTVANDMAVLDGTRILSAYRLEATGVKIWIITEWDRSVTTILLPSEY